MVLLKSRLPIGRANLDEWLVGLLLTSLSIIGPGFLVPILTSLAMPMIILSIKLLQMISSFRSVVLTRSRSCHIGWSNPCLMQSLISCIKSLHSSVWYPWSLLKSHHFDMSLLWVGTCNGGCGRKTSFLRLRISVQTLFSRMSWDGLTFTSIQPL